MNVIYSISYGDQYYIGSTSDWSSRKSNHRRALERNIHYNKRLQEAYNSHDSARGLEFKILEKVEGDPKVREQILLDRHIDDPKCLNVARLADRPRPRDLRAAQEKGRQSWYDSQQPFYLIKEGVEYGPFKTQKEAFDSLPISNVGVHKLWKGKRDKYNGFTLKFIT